MSNSRTSSLACLPKHASSCDKKASVAALDLMQQCCMQPQKHTTSPARISMGIGQQFTGKLKSWKHYWRATAPNKTSSPPCRFCSTWRRPFPAKQAPYSRQSTATFRQLWRLSSKQGVSVVASCCYFPTSWSASCWSNDWRTDVFTLKVRYPLTQILLLRFLYRFFERTKYWSNTSKSYFLRQRRNDYWGQ